MAGSQCRGRAPHSLQCLPQAAALLTWHPGPAPSGPSLCSRQGPVPCCEDPTESALSRQQGLQELFSPQILGTLKLFLCAFKFLCFGDEDPYLIKKNPKTK